MKLIESSVSIMPQEEGLLGVYKQIELAGRTCYKSEDKITPTSAKEFVDRMIASGHGSMLEFGTVYLAANIGRSEAYYKHCCPIDNTMEDWENNLFKYKSNKYSKYSTCIIGDYLTAFVTTNYRVLVEKGWLDDLKYLCEPTEFHEKRVCVRFTTDVGVSRELNKHRVDSIAEQSTRYCNFSKDKFGNELSIIVPPEFTEDEIKSSYLYSHNLAEDKASFFAGENYQVIYEQDMYDWKQLEWWIWANRCCELAYMNLIRLGWKPEQARRILPLDLHTELNHCAFVSDWKHFFELRCDKSAHPDMVKVATSLKEQFKNNNLI